MERKDVFGGVLSFLVGMGLYLVVYSLWETRKELVGVRRYVEEVESEFIAFMSAKKSPDDVQAV